MSSPTLQKPILIDTNLQLGVAIRSDQAPGFLFGGQGGLSSLHHSIGANLFLYANTPSQTSAAERQETRPPLRRAGIPTTFFFGAQPLLPLPFKINDRNTWLLKLGAPLGVQWSNQYAAPKALVGFNLELARYHFLSQNKIGLQSFAVGTSLLTTPLSDSKLTSFLIYLGIGPGIAFSLTR